jgi:uncharacterized membrane protein
MNKSLAKEIQLNEIVSLQISREQLNEFSGIQGLANLLVNNRSITDLDLYGLFIGAQGAKHIAKVLLMNSTCIVKINLSFNNIDEKENIAKML